MVFLERAGLLRCLRLVGPRVGPALGRAVMMVLIYAVYAAVVGFVMRLASAPFGGQQSMSLAGAAIVHLANAALTVPLIVYTVAATLVSYAEPRFREEPSTSVYTLAAAAR